MANPVAGTGLMRTFDEFVKREDATVSIHRKGYGDDGLWAVMCSYGYEAEDSPMVGAQALGMDDSLTAAIEHALGEARINPCATCGWEQTCEEGCHS